MIEKIKALCVKYREILVYLIVGVLTTVVSWVACFFCKLFLDETIVWQNNIINAIGWIAGVCFAYPTNRRWVFRSTNPQIFREFLGFAGSRVSTGLLEIVIMAICVNALHMDYWIAKIFIAAVLVTVLNYVFSKLLIFKNKDKKQGL